MKISRNRAAGNRGQAAVEYMLTTLALLFVFVMMYRILQPFLQREFKAGAGIIVRMHKEDPW